MRIDSLVGVIFKGKMWTFFWFSPGCSSVTIKWIYLSYGQNKTFEDAILGFAKQWSTLFTIIWPNNLSINRGNNQQINRKLKQWLFAALFGTPDSIEKNNNFTLQLSLKYTSFKLNRNKMKLTKPSFHWLLLKIKP